jgi:predicted small lipoprotein YifL
MRRYLLPTLLALLLAASIAATGQGAKKGPLSFKVTLVQEATVRHPHPPAGDAGDTFSTVLKLNAVGTVLGFPNGTPMGSMAFTWGPLNGSCSSNAASCSGTTTILTTTKLPGGTITANGKNISLSNGIILPIQGGTGVFKGVKGKVFVAPGGDHVDVFDLIMP